MEAAEENKKKVDSFIPHLKDLEEFSYSELMVLKLKFIQLSLKDANGMLERIAELLPKKIDVEVENKDKGPIGKCYCGHFRPRGKDMDLLAVVQILGHSIHDPSKYRANYVVLRKNTLGLENIKFDTVLTSCTWDGKKFELHGWKLAEITEEQFINIFVSMKTIYETLDRLELL